MAGTEVERQLAETLLREGVLTAVADTERELVAKIYREMHARFATLRAGENFVDRGVTGPRPDGPPQFERIQNMFPGGADEPPLATDIISVIVRDFPEGLLRHLSSLVAAWREIDREAGLGSYFPKPESYHVSVAVPQDLARDATMDPALHLLRPPSERLNAQELQAIGEAIVGLVHRRQRFLLRPLGARVGGDGALIFVFDFCDELLALRKEIIGWTKLITGGRYTGRTKPMFSITLARALRNATIGPKVEALLSEFGRTYMPADAPAAPTWELAPFEVTHLCLAHETRWMFAETSFVARIELGVSRDPIESLRAQLGEVRCDG